MAGRPSCSRLRWRRAVGVVDGARAEALVGPDLLAGGEFLADPAGAVGMAVEVAADEHHAAVVVLHHLVRVERLDRIVGPQTDGLAADPVARRHVDDAILVDGGRNHGDPAREILFPKNLAVRG